MQALRSMQFITEAFQDFAVTAKPDKSLLASRMGTCLLCYLLSSVGQRNAAVLSVQQSWELVLSPAVSLLLLKLKTNSSDPSVQGGKGTEVLEQLRNYGGISGKKSHLKWIGAEISWTFWSFSTFSSKINEKCFPFPSDWPFHKGAGYWRKWLFHVKTKICSITGRYL